MEESLKSIITTRLEELIIDMLPDATMRPMYGGTVIETRKDDPKIRISGFYVYTDYVSFEFSKGAQLDDPNKLLEGKGKMRRHVKLHSIENIDAKRCREFIQQAAKL